MGLIFGWLYTRWGRVLPFVIAHVVIDAAIFVGYPWAAATFPALFGLPGVDPHPDSARVVGSCPAATRRLGWRRWGLRRVGGSRA